MEKRWKIYALYNADGIFYVGASLNLKRRLKEHRYSFLFEFSVHILEECDADWRFRECYWIEKLRTEGVALRNKVGGGNGCDIISAETRAKLSAAKKGKPKPHGFGAKVSAAQRGVPKNFSPEGAARVRANQFKKGHVSGGKGWRDPAIWTPEKRSAAATKARNTFWKNCSPERRKEIALAVSAGLLNRSPEARSEASRAGGYAVKGIPKSPETKAKMAEARHRWWLRKRGGEHED